MAIRYIEQDRTFWLDTEHTSYLLAIVDQENFVGHVYYGQKLQYTENTPAPVYLLRMGEAPCITLMPWDGTERRFIIILRPEMMKTISNTRPTVCAPRAWRSTQ